MIDLDKPTYKSAGKSDWGVWVKGERTVAVVRLNNGKIQVGNVAELPHKTRAGTPDFGWVGRPHEVGNDLEVQCLLNELLEGPL